MDAQAARSRRREPDEEPQQESMRGDRRLLANPSTDQKKKRRQQRRVQPHAAGRWDWQTMTGHPEERMTDWDDVTRGWDMNRARIHRAITLYPEDVARETDHYKLMNHLEDPHASNEDKAAHVLDHLRASGKPLGRHWTTDLDHAKTVASDEGWSAVGNSPGELEQNKGVHEPLSVIVHARFPERHHIETDPAILEQHHVTPWGGSEHYEDESEVPLKDDAQVHVTGVSWATDPHPKPHEWTTHRYDPDVAEQERQEEAEQQRRHDDVLKSIDESGDRVHTGFHAELPADVHQKVLDSSVPQEDRARLLLNHLKPEHLLKNGWSGARNGSPLGMANLVASGPHRETGKPRIVGTIEGVTPPGTSRYDVRHNYAGVKIPVHRMQWRESTVSGSPYDDVHEHSFADPQRHIGRYVHAGQPVQERFRAVATQLGTSVERLIPGQSTITTPTGQQLLIKNVRPHESDGSYVYVDTPFGTSLVQRGTQINDTGGKPSGQQELPNAGNPMGNSGTLPMSGRGPQGGAAQPSSEELSAKPCPNCGREGGLRMSGGEMKCSYCGHEFPLANSPGGMTFSHEDSWSGQPRTNRGEAPTAHVWGSKYQTQERPGVIARRAQQVLSQMEENIL